MEMVQGHATEPPRILGFDVSQDSEGWHAQWVGTGKCTIPKGHGHTLQAADYPTLLQQAVRYRIRAWVDETTPSRFTTGDHA